MTEDALPIRTRERNPVVQKLITRFEGMMAEANLTATEQRETIRSLRFSLRDLAKRLRRYEVEPPVFPLPVMDQIKKLRHLGLPVADLASVYRTSESRINRVLSDEEIPLIVVRTPPQSTTRGRALHV